MQNIERIILTRLLADMRAAGYQPAAVWDGGDYVMAGPDGEVRSRSRAEAPARVERYLTDEEVIEAVDSVDVSTLHFTRQHQQLWGNRGVMLVLGNGEDVISDYHCGDEGEVFEEIIGGLYNQITAGEIR